MPFTQGPWEMYDGKPTFRWHFDSLTALLVAMPFSPEELDKAYQEVVLRNPYIDRELFMGEHLGSEHFWVGIQPFLLHRGYRLRPRYDPQWVPPWLRGPEINQNILTFEESLILGKGEDLLDAVRVSDGLKVVFKRVSTRSPEIIIAQYLSSPDLRSDPRNHTVPILDILPLPDDDAHALLVMPQLIGFNQVPFRRLGEMTDALHQYFEGLEFLHEHNIAHRDACYFNLMMDGSKVVPRGVHFIESDTHDGLVRRLEWNDRTSVGPVPYYIIDFGLSVMFPKGRKRQSRGPYGQDRSVPEHKHEEPHDPFKVDIYQLGRVIFKMIQEYDGLEPLLGIATAMTRQDPEHRISLRDALDQLDRIPKKKLKRRVWKRTCPIETRISIRFCGGSTKSRF
ncbi:hypothetical protein D9615_003093 [Tricholomella constricta]|uniref:Protein kinase domain-containing protein n=1 Tax=Tricholomella constricta TaxID=117010 RepID=A0A8H5M862_9AGAR|nr:hypothetical protein D9615_003093 [Tricholomella constricta]